MTTLLRTNLAVCVCVLTLAACERPPVASSSTGWRGIGMIEVENPRMRDADSTAVADSLPPEFPASQGDQGAMAAGTYQNVQVLGHLSELEFNRTMAAITQWVAPEQGCVYCHYVDPETGAVNMASDEVYTKVVSREMFRMAKGINQNWSSHVGEGGITCYNCHKGRPNPEYFWNYGDEPDGLRHLLDRDDIRVQSDYALASQGDNDVAILPDTWYTYETMMYISNALGVSCTFCHQTSRWADWEESPPTRTKALRGIRMVREANLQHMLVLEDDWPDNVRGPLGDGPKVECLTCHQGANLPLYGLMDGAGWPALHEPAAPNPPAASTAPAPAPAPDGGS